MEIPLNLLEPGAAASTDFRNFLGDLKANRLDRYLKRHLSYAEIMLDDDDHVLSADLKHYQI